MIFFFRSQYCVPGDLNMFSTQLTDCLANWSDGPYKFTLLKHDRLHFIWLMRTPYAIDHSFTISIFKDLFVTLTDPNKLLLLMAIRDPPRSINSLCTDEYDSCSAWSYPCPINSAIIPLACPRTCSFCNESRPLLCSFPSNLFGSWHDLEKFFISIDSRQQNYGFHRVQSQSKQL